MSATWSWKLLRAGSFRLDGGSMFGVVPKAVWAKFAPPDELNRIPLQTNCLLLERDGTRVLIETGFGEKWTDKERGLYELERRTIIDALREIDVAPESIEHIIVTHLHFDHAGALTSLGQDGDPVPTFPGAEIIVQRSEWQDALANKSTMTRTYLRSHLDPIAERVRLIDGAKEVLAGISVEPVPGHTWGQQSVWFRDAMGPMVFPGDVMPTVNHVGLPFSMGYDMLPYQNMLTKASLLERAVNENMRLVLDHEPGVAIVRVDSDAGRPGRFVLREA
jgi:glyoxylase-like metal-dependent hydrolase (beta-lactamase superfamily II)